MIKIKDKNYILIYLIGLIVALTFMLLNFWYQFLPLGVTILILFWAFNFLSGFGLILSIANGFLILMRKMRKRMKDRDTNIFIFLQIAIPIILIVYAIYKIILSYGNGIITQTGLWMWFNLLLYFYGIISLLLSLYILPIIQDEIADAVEMGKLNWWKKRLKRFARGIKKRYFELKKEYVMAQVQDQMTTKEILDIWRMKFAINLLLVIALGSVLITPIAYISIIFWLRLYLLFRKPFMKLERGILLISMIILGIVAILMPFLNFQFYPVVESYYWTSNIFYLIGIVIASIIFIRNLLSLQGYTLPSLKMRKKEYKIKKLEKQKADLEEQLERSKKQDN